MLVEEVAVGDEDGKNWGPSTMRYIPLIRRNFTFLCNVPNICFHQAKLWGFCSSFWLCGHGVAQLNLSTSF